MLKTIDWDFFWEFHLCCVRGSTIFTEGSVDF